MGQKGATIIDFKTERERLLRSGKEYGCKGKASGSEGADIVSIDQRRTMDSATEARYGELADEIASFEEELKAGGFSNEEAVHEMRRFLSMIESLEKDAERERDHETQNFVKINLQIFRLKLLDALKKIDGANNNEAD